MKVEAVVVRDRVETVMEAVEAHTGHVGVTVIEAVGHGREKGITHEYRGRVFESRFLPKAHHDVRRPRRDRRRRSWQRSSTRPAPGTRAATASAGCRPSQTSRTTAQERSSRRSRAYEHQGSCHRGQHGLGGRRSDPRDLHAGRLRVPRGRADADEERRPHRGEERAHPRDRVDRLLPRRVRARVRRRRQRPRRRLRASSRRSTSCSRSGRRRSRGSPRSRRRRRTCSRSPSRRSRSRSCGARWRSAPGSGCTSPSASSSRSSTRSSRTGSGARTAGSSRGACRTSPARRSSTTRGRSPGSPGRSCSGRGSGSTARTGSRTRSRATTWRSRRSACSSSGSAGSASTPARRCRVDFGGVGFFAYVALNTNLAAAAGVLGAVITSWIVIKKPDLSMMLNGAIAALVAITAACAFVAPWAAIVIGLVSGDHRRARRRCSSSGSGSTTRSARSPHTACRASGARCSLGFFTVPALADEPRDGAGRPASTAAGCTSSASQALGLAAVGAFTFTASFLVLLADAR